jgi:serine/threonine protein kinase
VPFKYPEIIALIEKNKKFKIIEEFHEGFNAYAFKALHLHLDKEVFLKVYYYENPADLEIFREPRFLVEATSASSGNQNLVQIYDAEILNEEHVLMVMEFINGKSLLSYLKIEPFNLMDAIHIIRGILNGLAILHSLNLVHRDIKPANILIEESNNNFLPRICDFGSVSRLSGSNSSVCASKHSALYVPPEGWSDPSEFFISSDLYQVGLVFYELLNGSLPYDPISYLDRTANKYLKDNHLKTFEEIPDDCEKAKFIDSCIFRRCSNGKIITLKKSLPYIPDKVKKIYNKATNPEIEKRFDSCSSFLSAFSSCFYPNWFKIENFYAALNWNRFDLRVSELSKRSGIIYTGYRARANTNNFRKFGPSANNIKQIFSFFNNT